MAPRSFVMTSSTIAEFSVAMPVIVCHGLEVGARPDPVFAVAGVGEELLGVGAGAGAEVQGHIVAVLGRFEDEHGVGFGIGLEPGEMDEGRVSAEAIVGVIGPDLEPTCRNDEAFAGEGLRDPGTTRGSETGRGEGFGIERGAIPTGGDEVAEGLGVRAMRAVVDAVCECLSRVVCV
jgi:hypothetical protein